MSAKPIENQGFGQHYDHTYHEIFGPTRQAVTRIIAERILHKNTALMVDIGGGTGDTIERLKNITSQTQFILLEPFQSMIEQAMRRKEKPDFVLKMDAETFASANPLNQKLDAVLCQEAIHHVKNLSAFFSGIFGNLKIGGRILIITRPLMTEMPFGDHGKKSWIGPDAEKPDKIASLLQKAGFQVTTAIHSFPIAIAKTRWLEIIGRGSIFSNIWRLTEAEIDEDQHQIAKENAHTEQLHFNDNQLFILGEKIDTFPSKL